MTSLTQNYTHTGKRGSWTLRDPRGPSGPPEDLQNSQRILRTPRGPLEPSEESGRGPSELPEPGHRQDEAFLGIGLSANQQEAEIT